MSEELDRRVAIEVMGEAEPPMPDAEVIEEWRPAAHDRSYLYSEHSNWSLRFDCWYDANFKAYWEPLPFSTHFNHALRAWETFRIDFKRRCGFSVELVIRHDAEWEMPFVATTGYTSSTRGAAQDLPESICNLVLACVERSKE